MDEIHLYTVSMNCSSSCDNCTGLTSTFWWVYEGIYVAAYYVMAPIFFIFGLTGHILCLVSFVRECRKETAYSYQIFVSISQASEVVFYILYVLSLKLASGVEKDSAVWFRNSHVLVWYTAHLATPLSNMCITTSLILALCMAIDRFCALYYPHAYKNWNHRRNRVISLLISIGLGISTSLFAVLRYQILESDDPDHGTYTIVLDIQYASTTTAYVLSHVRNLIRMAAAIMLILCNTVNWRLFRSRVLKVGIDETDGNAPGHSGKTQRVRLEVERTLFVLVIVESTLSTLGMTALTAYFFAIFTSPTFTKCGGLLMIPLVDVLLNVTNMGKFYIMLGVDARFRRMVLRACSRKNTPVEPPADVRLDRHALATHERYDHAYIATISAC